MAVKNPDEGRPPKTTATQANVRESNVPFYFLIVFTFVVYIGPQIYFSFLRPLHLAMASALLAGVAYLLNKLNSGQPLFKIDFETRLLIIILFLAILSIPFSVWPGGSFHVLKNEYIKAIIIFFLLAHVLTSVPRIRKMLWSIIYFCSFLSYVGIKHFVDGNVYGNYSRIRGAGAPITSNPNDLALTLVLMIPFALTFFMTERGWRKLYSVAYFILSTFAIICTFSRGGFIVLVVVSAVFFYKMAKKNGPKALFVAIALTAVIVPLFPQGYTERLYSIFHFSQDQTGSAYAREASTLAAFSLVKKNPLLGVGLGMNTLALNDRGFYWTQVHNVYLQIGAELGIPAMVIFILLFWRLIHSMQIIQRKLSCIEGDVEKLYLAQGMEISLIGFAVAAVFHPVAYHFYFYYLAGFAVALNRLSKSVFNTMEVPPQNRYARNTFSP
jgi:O-antigen ligase